MSLLASTTSFAHATKTVLTRRLKSGPAHIAWPFYYEVLVQTLKNLSSEAEQLPPKERRAFWDSRVFPHLMASKVSISPVAVSGIKGAWFMPREGPQRSPVVLYLHGGGFVFGSIHGTHQELLCRLALATGGRVLGLSYRLAPEYTYPAALEDTLAAYRWLRDSSLAPGEIVFVGDSSGGALCLSALLALKEMGEPLPAGAVLISPVVDLSAQGGSLTENARYDWLDWGRVVRSHSLYHPGVDPRDPVASPLFGDLSELPPLLIQVGDVEILYDQGRELANRAQEAGVEVDLEIWEHMVHVWHAFASLNLQARQAIDQIGNFVRERTRSRLRPVPPRPVPEAGR